LKHQALIFALTSLISASIHAQSGCTDAQAINYDPTATIDDGSCQYGPTQYTITDRYALSNSLEETSGLTFFNGSLWTINDSGNPPYLFQLNPQNGNILNTWVIDSVLNYDWEAITHSQDEIFIADFGNNGGNRQNLHILRIQRSDLSHSDTLTASTIHFSFSEQIDFSNQYQQTNFDVEAFFHHDDSLFIFTKNWGNEKTYLYALPTNIDSAVLSVRDSMDVGGLITGASYSENIQTAVLTGYEHIGSGLYQSFCWILKDFQGNDFIGGNQRRIDLGLAIGVGQNEGIFLFSDGTGFISAERIAPFLSSAFLNEFDFSGFLSDTLSIYEFTHSFPTIYPNPANSSIFIDLPLSFAGSDLEVYDSENKLIFKKRIHHQKEMITIENWPIGTYILYLPKVHRYASFVIIR
jgi:hypothetical protein